MATLTSRTLAQSTAITPTTLIHIVTTADTSQSVDGSSYKAELQQLSSIFSGSFSGGSGNCITDLYVSNIHSCSPLRINPLDEGNVYFGSSSGVTIDLANSGNTLVKGRVFAQSDSANLSTLSTLSVTNGLKGQITYFSHTGGTTNLLYNPNTSGYTQISVGANTSQNKDIQLTYYGSDYVRAGSPINGTSFYKNKGVLSAGNNTDGTIVNITPTGSTGNLWFEQNGNSIMYLKGNGSQGLLGIGLNPNGTEVPTSNLQIGGTGTTGTIKYRDGNQQSGYVLTSDSTGNATWQQQTGYQYYSAVTVTSAQTLTLFTLPVEILPAPGANKYYDFKVYFEYTYNTTPYVSGRLSIVDNTGKGITNEFDIESAQNVILVSGMDSASNAFSTVNSNLRLKQALADPTGGNGSLKIKIFYNIVNFG